MHNKSVEIVDQKKWLHYASNCSVRLTSITNTVFIGQAYQPHPPLAVYFLLMYITMQVNRGVARIYI